MINKSMIGKTISIFLGETRKVTGVLISINRIEDFIVLKTVNGNFKTKIEKVDMLLEWEEQIVVKEITVPNKPTQYDVPRPTPAQPPPSQYSMSEEDREILLRRANMIEEMEQAEQEPNHYGSFIPADMLLQTEDEIVGDEEVDFSISAASLKNPNPIQFNAEKEEGIDRDDSKE